ncbi:MAG: GIY-YIG nuclease family protein [Rhizobiales bacterium]|nr:GIY-YIG nuclease family protein [Hyphomicrobiales bacterium]
MSAFVYILRCADGSYYVGSTRGDDVARRVSEHQSGLLPGYTSRRRPVVLVWAGHFPRIVDAIAFERQVKGWRRAKKEALIEGELERLPMLASRLHAQT